MVHFLIYFSVDEGIPFRLYYIVLKNLSPPHRTLFLFQFCDIKNSTKVSKIFAKLVKFTLEKKKLKKNPTYFVE